MKKKLEMNNINQQKSIIYKLKQQPFLVFVTLYTLISLYLYLILSIGTPICFDDCGAYIALAGKSGSDYYDTFNTMFRSWTIPIFFSLFGEYNTINALQIVIAQTLISYIAWLLFSCSIATYFKGIWQYISFIFIFNLIFLKGAYHFNEYLLSDSLGLSSVLFYFSYILFSKYFIRPFSPIIILNMIIYIFLMLIVVGTRDANLMIVTTCTIGFVYLNRKHLSLTAKISFYLALCIVLIIAAHGAMKRNQVNIEEIMVVSVLPHPEVRDFFTKHGMPAAYLELASQIQPQDLDNIDPQITGNYKQLYEAITPSFSSQARLIYLAYLIEHPVSTIATIYRYKSIIFEQYWDFNSHYSIGADAVYIKPGNKVTTIMPMSNRISLVDYFSFNTKMLLIIVFYLIILIMRQFKKLLIPTFFIVLGLLNAIGGFLADNWEFSEMQRHALIGSIIFDIGFVVLLLVFLEVIFDKYRNTNQISRTIKSPGTRKS